MNQRKVEKKHKTEAKAKFLTLETETLVLNEKRPWNYTWSQAEYESAVWWAIEKKQKQFRMNKKQSIVSKSEKIVPLNSALVRPQLEHFVRCGALKTIQKHWNSFKEGQEPSGNWKLMKKIWKLLAWSKEEEGHNSNVLVLKRVSNTFFPLSSKKGRRYCRIIVLRKADSSWMLGGEIGILTNITSINNVW